MKDDFLKKRILAFDTSWDFGVVGTVTGGETVDKVYSRSPRAASEGLLPWIMEVMGRSGWERKDIELVAVGRGPGSFTGTRIAVAVAKGLVEILQVPLVSVSSVESIALTLGDSRKNAPVRHVAVLMDARKGEIMLGIYRILNAVKKTGGDSVDLPGVAVLIVPSLLTPGDALDMIVSKAGKIPHLTVCGNAFRVYPDLRENLSREAAITVRPDEFLIDPVSIALLAIGRALEGEQDEPSSLEPVYLR